jgi:hypothetical protein
MLLTNEQEENKLNARRVLGLPVEERPEDTVFYTPSTVLENARYRVVFGSTVVYFQLVNGRFIYLGEYPLATFPDLVEYFSDQADTVYCEACREACDDLKLTDIGWLCIDCNYDGPDTLAEMRESLPDLDTCTRCKTFMRASDGEMTDDGFRCSDCLEIARKFETLTEAVEILMAAVKEAYPTTDDSAYSVRFSCSGFVTISQHLRKEDGREIPVAGFSDPQGVASDFLHRIKANKEHKAEATGWVEGQPYFDMGTTSVADQLALDGEVYTHLMPVEPFNADDRPTSVKCVPSDGFGNAHPMWRAEYSLDTQPIVVSVSTILPNYKL